MAFFKANNCCLSQQYIRSKCVHLNGTFTYFKKSEIEQSISERFEQQVAQFSKHLAVKTRRKSLTYAELNNMANWIALTLLKEKQSQVEPIAILLEQGTDSIAAFLGILKAGKFYVYLDPFSPNTRLKLSLKDSGAILIVTNNSNILLAKTLAGSRCKLINIDQLDTGATDNLQLSISPDALVCIAYTSGSTGKPKGVLENHRNLLHQIMRHTNRFHICPEDRWMFLQSLSTLAAAHSIFSALLNGATLYPVDIRNEGVTNLASWMLKEEITNYSSVITIFRHFVATLSGNEYFPKLRLIQVGGEPVLKRDVQLYKRYFSKDCILVTNLGATEMSSVLEFYIDKDTELDTNTVPVGYPVDDMEILLVDDNDREIGYNQSAEIVVKSRYLSPGYWHNSDKATVALNPTFLGKERIYRTGDLAIRQPNGCLLHLGRKDSQVKIKGNRVEMSEIEMALYQQDNIKEVTIIANKDQRGDLCLVACLVPKSKPFPSPSAIRRALVEIMPSYMIPADFVFLEQLPLTLTGKVNHQILAGLVQEKLKTERSLVNPLTPLEKSLAQIWSEVLRMSQVGINENFFILGGDSLLAMQVMNRVQKACHLKLPIQLLFEAPTIAQLSERIETIRWMINSQKIDNN